MRSLRWGLELIEAMQLDQRVPESLRDQAAQLQPSYPTHVGYLLEDEAGQQAAEAVWRAMHSSRATTHWPTPTPCGPASQRSTAPRRCPSL